MLRPDLLALRWAVKLREMSEQVWEHWRVGFVLIVTGAFVCGYWLLSLPAPGYAIAVMGVAAALMAGRTKASGYEKAGWMLVMFGLLVVETLAIRKDRRDNERIQGEAHKEQKNNFSDIGDGIKAAIKESQNQFQATMSRIDTTLKTSEATLRNTQPNAMLEFTSLYPEPPFILAANHPVTMVESFTNSGNDVALNQVFYLQLYVRPPDYVDSNKELVNEFEESARKGELNINELPLGAPIRPHVDDYAKYKRVFTEAELKGIRDHTMTPFALIRFRWTDKTGDWTSDECYRWFDITKNFIDMEPCRFFSRPRYRTKKHH